MRTRRDLALFAVATLVVSWGPLTVAGLIGPDVRHGPAQVLFAVGTSGPTLAALGLWLAGRRRPRTGARPWRAARRWLPAALLLGVAPVVAGVAVSPLLGGAAPDWSAPGTLVTAAGGPLVVAAGLLVAGPLAEEFGWRGYAQPRLRRFLSPAATATVLGVVWALWHLPLYLLPGTGQHATGLLSPQAALFAVSCVPLSYLAWYVSERLGGGVAAAIALHAATNAASTLLGPRSLPAAATTTGLLVVLSLVVAATVWWPGRDRSIVGRGVVWPRGN